MVRDQCLLGAIAKAALIYGTVALAPTEESQAVEGSHSPHAPARRRSSTILFHQATFSSVGPHRRVRAVHRPRYALVLALALLERRRSGCRGPSQGPRGDAHRGAASRERSAQPRCPVVQRRTCHDDATALGAARRSTRTRPAGRNRRVEDSAHLLPPAPISTGGRAEVRARRQSRSLPEPFGAPAMLGRPDRPHESASSSKMSTELLSTCATPHP